MNFDKISRQEPDKRRYAKIRFLPQNRQRRAERNKQNGIQDHIFYNAEVQAAEYGRDKIKARESVYHPI